MSPLSPLSPLKSYNASPISQIQPATPPLAPRKDINAFSPSPLQIRSVMDSGRKLARNSMKNVQTPASETKSNTGPEEEKENASPETETEDGDLAGEDPTKNLMQSKRVQEKDIQVSLLALSLDDPGAIAVVAEIDPVATSGSSSSIGSGTQASASALPDITEHKYQSCSLKLKENTNQVRTPLSRKTTEINDSDSANSKYVSPSDALMSPCTLKLNVLKGKRLAKSGKDDSGVRRLFAGRIPPRVMNEAFTGGEPEVKNDEEFAKDVLSSTGKRNDDVDVEEIAEARD